MIVLTLGGLGRLDTVETALGGYCTAEGRTHVVVDYPREGNAASILAGVVALDTAVRWWAPRDQVTVMGHSQGAEVISEWLQRYASRGDAPLRGNLRFILTGNPCRRLGGVVTAGTWVTKQGYLGRRKPTPETQYDVLDVSRLGDTWSNADGWPTMKRPRVSLLQKIFRLDPHSDYRKVRIEECTLRERSGNTRYLVAP